MEKTIAFIRWYTKTSTEMAFSITVIRLAKDSWLTGAKQVIRIT